MLSDAIFENVQILVEACQFINSKILTDNKQNYVLPCLDAPLQEELKFSFLNTLTENVVNTEVISAIRN